MNLSPAIRSISALATLAATALLLSSCVLGAPTLEPVRHEIERDLPEARFEPETRFHLGRISLALGRAIAQVAVDDEEGRQAVELLRHIKGVEIAVYTVKDLGPEARPTWPASVERLGRRNGWETVARFRDEGAVGSVLYREKNGAIRSIYVFILDDESLVLARFRGHLDEAMADAIALSGKDLPELLLGERGRGAAPAAEEGEPSGGEEAAAMASAGVP